MTQLEKFNHEQSKSSAPIMNNNPQFESMLKKNWNTIPVPSRAEYKKIITDVTHQTMHRNTHEGNLSNLPSPYYVHMKKYLIGITSVVAVIALIIIIPRTHQDGTNPTNLTPTETTYGITIPAKTSTYVVDQVVRDLLVDAVTDADIALAETYTDESVSEEVLFQELANTLSL